MLLFMLSLGIGSLAQAEPRNWTNTQGKQIQAEFGGIKDGQVTLILANGQSAIVALTGLSAEDQAWVRLNASKAILSVVDPADASRVSWDKRRMPTEVKEPMLYMNIKVVKEGPGQCIYESGHFQFKTSAKLGPILMKDVCRAFESTYELVRLMPWGIVPRPEEGRKKFQAELYALRDQYLATGAPTWSAGVYVRKDKVFRMPFKELGISDTVGANGAYYRKGAVNNDTITHEITHQMMHEYLPYMPVWLIEGMAEYTSNLPYKGGVFSVGGDGAAFVTKQPDSRNRGLFGAVRYQAQWLGVEEMWGYTTDISKRHPITRFTLAEKKQEPPKASGQPTAGTPPESVVIVRLPGAKSPEEVTMANLANRYYSSHVLAYFFVHDDGGRRLMQYFDALHEEKKKWPAFWEQAKAHNAELDKLKPTYDAYRKSMDEFMRLPGVKDLGDGRFSYPLNLTPPTPPPQPPKRPEPPDNTDPDAVCVKHLRILLGERTLEALDQEVRAMFQKNGFSL